MENLRIEESGSEYIIGNSLTRNLYINSSCTDKFSSGHLLKLRDWLNQYNIEHQEPITILGPGSYYNLKYQADTLKNNMFPNNNIHWFSASVNEVLKETIELYNFKIKGSTYYPSVYGFVDPGFIIFAGDSYYSYIFEFFAPIFFWLDNTLTLQKPQEFRLEFWMSYFNTSTKRRFIEIFEGMGVCNKKYGTQVSVYWYFQEGDIDVSEEGKALSQIITKKLPEISFTIKEVTNEQYLKMTKSFT